MPDFKEMSFMMFFLLISISAIYEWANDEELNPVLSRELGVDFIEEFESTTMRAQVSLLQVASTTLISNIVTLNPLYILLSVTSFFSTIWIIFMKLMFGWAALLGAIFDAIGMADLALVFITPLAVIQLFGALYFIRDIVNTVRGVG